MKGLNHKRGSRSGKNGPSTSQGNNSTSNNNNSSSNGTTTNSGNASSTTNTTMPNAWSRPLRTPPGFKDTSNNNNNSSSHAKSHNSSNGKTGHGSNNNSNNVAPLRERFLHLCVSLVGETVELTQTDGKLLEGIFHTFTPFANGEPKYVLKAVKQRTDPNNTNGNNGIIPNGSTVILPSSKVQMLHCKSMRFNGAKQQQQQQQQTPNDLSNSSSSFQTDTQISQRDTHRQSELVAAGSAWTTPSYARKGGLAKTTTNAAQQQPSSSTSLQAMANSSSKLKGSIGQWDQFKANQQLFNVSATFDENLYTTQLDKSQINYEQIQEAERIAREIETTTSTNLHVAEERNQVVEHDYDEEDRYSGVLSKSRTKMTTLPKMNYAAAAAGSEPPGFLRKSRSALAKKTTSQKVPQREVKDLKLVVTANKEKTPDETALEPEQEKEKEEEPEKETEIPAPQEEKEPPADDQPTRETETSTSKNAEEEPTEEEASTEKEIASAPPETTKEELQTDDSTSEEKKEQEEEEVPPVSKEEAPKEEKESTETEESGDATPPAEADAQPSTTITTTTEEEEEEPPKETKKPVSKLNANAKEFTLNPGAKSFSPGSFSAPAAPEQHQPMMDPNTGLPATMPPQIAGYIQHPMGQPGMIPMINPMYAPMQYQRPYPAMDQHGVPIPAQPQHLQQHPPQTPQMAADGTTEEQGDQTLHPVPVPYPPAFYGGMPIQQQPQQPQQPQGGGRPMGGYHPHYPHPHHPHVQPRYPQFYAMTTTQPHPPPPPHAMRGGAGPNGYYPPPMHVMGEDDFRGRGGRGPGRGGRRNSKRNGRGGRGYGGNYNGRQTPLHHFAHHPPAMDAPPNDESGEANAAE